MLVRVRFKARERESSLSNKSQTDKTSLPADAEDARSPQDFREDEISPQKKALNWVII